MRRFVISSLALLALLPAHAAYLKVLDKEVNIQGTTVVTGIASSLISSGSISYDPSKKQLELNNVKATNTTALYVVQTDVDGLTIRVTGTCSFDIKGAFATSSKNLTIAGSAAGSAKLTCVRNNSILNDPLLTLSCKNNSAKLDIKNVTLNLTDNAKDLGVLAAKKASATTYKASLYMERAVVNLKASHAGTTSIMHHFDQVTFYQCGIRSSNGLFYNTDTGYAGLSETGVTDAQGNKEKAELLIDSGVTPITAYPLKVCDTYVTTFNASRVKDFGKSSYIDYDQRNNTLRLFNVNQTFKLSSPALIVYKGNLGFVVETYGDNVITANDDFLVGYCKNTSLSLRGTGANSSSLTFTNTGLGQGKGTCVNIMNTGNTLYLDGGNFKFTSPSAALYSETSDNQLCFMNTKASLTANITYSPAIWYFGGVNFVDCKVTQPSNFSYINGQQPMSGTSTYFGPIVIEPKETTQDNGELRINNVIVTEANSGMDAIVKGVSYSKGVITLDNVDFSTNNTFIMSNFDLTINVVGSNKIRCQNFLWMTSGEDKSNAIINGSSKGSLTTEATSPYIADYNFQGGGNLTVNDMNAINSNTSYVSLIGDWDSTVLTLAHSSGKFTTGQSNRSAVMGIGSLVLDGTELIDITYAPGNDGYWSSPTGKPFQFKAVETGVKGDVNGDGKVDVEDVNAAINIILELKNSSDYKGNADLTGDGKVDVEDVNAIINIILTH